MLSSDHRTSAKECGARVALTDRRHRGVLLVAPKACSVGAITRLGSNCICGAG